MRMGFTQACFEGQDILVAAVEGMLMVIDGITGKDPVHDRCGKTGRSHHECQTYRP